MTSEVSNPAPENAEAIADAMNARLIASEQEHRFMALQEKNEALSKDIKEKLEMILTLEKSLFAMESTVKEKDMAFSTLQDSVTKATRRVEIAEESEKETKDRMARVSIEMDNLRQEISRLQNDNIALQSRISEYNATSTLSSSSVAPLQFENSRLRAELESANGHRKWLENELHTRSSEIADTKAKHSETERNLRSLLNASNASKEESLSELASQKMYNESLKRRLEMSQRELLEKEENHANTIHELRLEVQTEKRLVALNKENMNRLEDRYNDVVREMQSLKDLASVANQEHLLAIENIKTECEEDFNQQLVQITSEYESKIQELKREIGDAAVDRAQLEDQLMSIGGVRVPQIEWHTDNDEPMTLTKLYEKLAVAEDIIRKEQSERKKLELYLQRVQEDLETQVPRQMQERKEYEFAMAQAHEIQLRLNDALQERQRAINELHRVEKELSETSREYEVCNRESRDLAQQVQTLLQRSLEDGDLASEMAEQSRRLIQEKHRMSIAIDELNQKLEHDSIQKKLRDFDAMKEEMQNQETLVANIIQQRDLYRALLSKHDARLLAESGGGGAIVAKTTDLERFSESENRNKELSDKVSQLSAEVSSLNNLKIGLEERLSRTDAYANDLSMTVSKLQSELSAAHSATARSKAEASFYILKVQRLEDSLDSSKKELTFITNEQQRFLSLNADLQQKLATSIDEQSKLQEELRLSQVQIRFVEGRLASLVETEARLTADNKSLRSELSRHIALQESIQKLETQLSAKSNDSQNRLEDEVNKLSITLQSEQSKFSVEKEKLENLLADADLRVRNAENSYSEINSYMLKLKDELQNVELEKAKLKEKCDSLENSLNSATAMVGESDVDVNDHERIQTLTLEIQTLKDELQVANQRVDDFKRMAKETESTLIDSTRANIDFKEATSAEIDKLRNELKASNEAAKAKQKAFEDLSNDLNSKKSGQEKTLSELNSKIESLENELNTAKTDRESYKSRYDEIKMEIGIYKADVRAAKDNYERELALHAEARKELQKARDFAEAESLLLRNKQAELDNMRQSIENERSILAETNQRQLELDKQSQIRIKELQEQNDILHNQISHLNDLVEKRQSEKLAATEDGGVVEKNLSISNADDATILEKQVSDLREVLRYVRHEKEILETQLQSARRSIESERAAAEIAKRSLEQLRIEIDLISKKKDETGSVNSNVDVLEAKLKQYEDQIDILKDSNRLLREETNRLQEFIAKSKSENSDLRNRLDFAEQKALDLEMTNSAFEAEKISINRELNDWKDRVKNLVTQFHQIDPEEHKTALTQVQESRDHLAKLQNEKDQVERDCANAKALILRLNKKIQEQKTQLDTAKASLEKVVAEKDMLLKSSEGFEATSNEAKELRTALEAAEKKLEAASAEKMNLENRMENLKGILRNNKMKTNETQLKFQEAIQAEKDARKKLEQEKESLAALLKEKSKSMIPVIQEENVAASESEGLEVTTDTTMVETSPQVTENPVDAEMPTNEAPSVPPIPKVPKEGFTFVASEIIRPTSENSKSASREAHPPAEFSEKAMRPDSEGNEIVLSSSKSDNVDNTAEVNLENPSDSIQTDAATQNSIVPAQSSTAHVLASSVEVADENISSDQPEQPTNAIATPQIDLSKNAQSSTKISTEMSLKEKLLEKKRKVAQSLAAKKLAIQANASTDNDGIKGLTASNDNLQSQGPEFSESIDNSTEDKISEPKNDIITAVSAEQKDVGESDERPKKISKIDPGSSLNPSAEPFKIFGSVSSAPSFGGSPPIFGSASSSSAPVFGVTSTTTGGAFLNLKPPGSGPAPVLTFGSSPNITIPTPSKDVLSGVNQPFKGTSVGSFPFGSSTISQTPPSSIFGSASDMKTTFKEEDKLAQVAEEDENDQVEGYMDDLANETTDPRESSEVEPTEEQEIEETTEEAFE